jgi:hypothetical protein
VTPLRPIINAEFPLYVSKSAGKSDAIELQVSINLDPEAEKLFQVDGFNFECSSTGGYLCVVTSEITGTEYPEEYENWGELYSVGISTRAKGAKKWTKLDTQSFNLGQNAEYAISKEISVSTEVAAKVIYRKKTYNLTSTALPIPSFKLSAPGSAIVGKDFTLVLTGPKKYSASCMVNYSVPLVIKNGYGKSVLYGKKPGNLHLFVVCKANSNWAVTSGWRDVYIRG